MWTAIQRSLPLLYTWLSATLALWITDSFFESIWFDRFETLLISSLLLSLVNTFIKPILLLLTLPIALFTLGLAIPLLNGLILMGVAEVVTGFVIASYWVSVMAAFVMSIILFLINLALGQTQVRAQFARSRSARSHRAAEATPPRRPRAKGSTGSTGSMGSTGSSTDKTRDHAARDDVIDVEAKEKPVDRNE